MVALGQGQFGVYATEIQVLDKKSMDVNASCIDRIFQRANQDRTGGLDFFDRECQGKKLKELVGVNSIKDAEMELKEFICANVRLAHAKVRRHPPLLHIHPGCP